MRLRTHIATANEELVVLVNEGYNAISAMQADYQDRKEKGTYDDSKDVDALVAPVDAWAEKVVRSLGRIFPTQLETHLFLDPEIPLGAVSGDYKYQSALVRCRHFVRGLNKIRLQSLPEYTDLPLDARLYVEDIDSFRKVRDVNPAAVMDVLTDGYLDRSEDSVQTALERILSVPFHKKDWGGELNDLYTANLLINGARHETAFLLKGNGLRSQLCRSSTAASTEIRYFASVTHQRSSLWFSSLAESQRLSSRTLTARFETRVLKEEMYGTA